MTRILTITLIFIFGVLSLSSCTQGGSDDLSGTPFEAGATIETPVEGGDDSNTPSGSIY